MKLHKDVKSTQSKNIFKNIENRLNKIHNNKYDYSLSFYKNSHYKMKIICEKHGEFLMSTNNHIKGAGCKKCYNDVSKISKTANQIINEFEFIHNDEYDYSKVMYKGNKEKIIVICKKHGEFFPTPNNHLKGTKCPKCARKRIDIERRKDTKWFIEKCIKIYGNLFDYSESVYIKNKDNIQVRCYKHGLFDTTPNRHLRGNGCPHCSKSGYKIKKPAILYYIKTYLGYKIGITNRTIQQRFGGKKFNIIKIWKFSEGKTPLDYETKILKEFNEVRNTSIIESEFGTTEIFNRNILTEIQKLIPELK